jgi:hypothetical protein
MQVEIAIGDRLGSDLGDRAARPAARTIDDEIEPPGGVASDRRRAGLGTANAASFSVSRSASTTSTPSRAARRARDALSSHLAPTINARSRRGNGHFSPRQKRCRRGAGEPLSRKKNVENQRLRPLMRSSKKPRFGPTTERVWRITGAKTSRLCAKQLVRSSSIPAQRFRLTDNGHRSFDRLTKLLLAMKN